ncbi:unnamed protein product [Ectocarpus sp. 12 AP-2014]
MGIGMGGKRERHAARQRFVFVCFPGLTMVAWVCPLNPPHTCTCIITSLRVTIGIDPKVSCFSPSSVCIRVVGAGLQSTTNGCSSMQGSIPFKQSWGPFPEPKLYRALRICSRCLCPKT